MRIGITIFGERVSPLFDTAATLLFVNEKDGKEIERQLIDLEENDRIWCIQQNSLDVLICGAISNNMERRLDLLEIQHIAWVCGKHEEILESFLRQQELSESSFMPGCCKRRRFIGSALLMTRQCQKKQLQISPKEKEKRNEQK